MYLSLVIINIFIVIVYIFHVKYSQFSASYYEILIYTYVGMGEREGYFLRNELISQIDYYKNNYYIVPFGARGPPRALIHWHKKRNQRKKKKKKTRQG